MTYFPDLSPYRYIVPPGVDPALNIGWLSPEMPFQQGNVPWLFVERLKAHCTGPLFNSSAMRHPCELCHASSAIQAWVVPAVPSDIACGTGEIRVEGTDGRLYAAPQLVLHYVVAHHYCPPDEFIQAVIDGPLPGSLHHQAIGTQLEQRITAWLAKLPPREYVPYERWARGVQLVFAGILYVVIFAGAVISIARPIVSLALLGMAALYLLQLSRDSLLRREFNTAAKALLGLILVAVAGYFIFSNFG